MVYPCILRAKKTVKNPNKKAAFNHKYIINIIFTTETLLKQKKKQHKKNERKNLRKRGKETEILFMYFYSWFIIVYKISC